MPEHAQNETDKIKCPNCGFLNRPGSLLCDNCGTLLTKNEKDIIGTRKLREGEEAAANPMAAHETVLPPKTEALPSPPSSEKKPAENRNSVFEENMTLRLEIEGAPTPITISPRRETLIGRRDPATGTMPDIDLTGYAGYRLGVSRKHAVIRLQNKRLEIYDLGSSNGTTLNGVRLAAHQPHLLRDGDEIALGKMVMRVVFHPSGAQ